MLRQSNMLLNRRLLHLLRSASPLSQSSETALLRPRRSNLLLLPSIQSRSIIRIPRGTTALVPVGPPEPLIPPPRRGGPPLLERRSDRELPDVTPSRGYLIHVPLFIITMIIATALLFNYQRSSSSVISSTLYALRVHPRGRELLGNEIQFRSKWPWISGKMDQLHGKIEVSYAVKGSKAEGTMHFRSYRKKRWGTFKTEEWSITMADGEKIDLLEDVDLDEILGG